MLALATPLSFSLSYSIPFYFFFLPTLPALPHSSTPKESPVHSLVSLDWLMGLVIKGGGVGKAMKGLHAKRKGILATSEQRSLKKMS